MSRTQYAYRINTEEEYDQVIIAPTMEKALRKWRTVKKSTAKQSKKRTAKGSRRIESIRCMGQVVGIVK